jgi:hypothetical protein
VLPDIVGDAGRVEAEEQLLAEDRGEGQGHVAKKHKGRQKTQRRCEV